MWRIYSVRSHDMREFQQMFRLPSRPIEIYFALVFVLIVFLNALTSVLTFLHKFVFCTECSDLENSCFMAVPYNIWLWGYKSQKHRVSNNFKPIIHVKSVCMRKEALVHVLEQQFLENLRESFHQRHFNRDANVGN